MELFIPLSISQLVNNDQKGKNKKKKRKQRDRKKQVEAGADTITDVTIKISQI